MKKSRFSETEIVYAIKPVEAGISLPEVAGKYWVSSNTIYAWRKRYAGLRRTSTRDLDSETMKRQVAELVWRQPGEQVKCQEH